MDVCGTLVVVFASLEVTRCSKASDFCGVVPILRENSSKSILFLRAFQGLSFDVASRNAVDVRFRSSERVTSAVETVSPCCARLFELTLGG